MPRNPDKKRCQTPNCRAWAMHDYDRCRSHLDDILGPRHAGAPKGNVNALKSGKYTHPASTTEIDRLATVLILDPQRFVHHIAQATYSIHSRSDDPLKSIVLLRRLTAVLEDRMFEITFAVELENALHALPPERRPGFNNVITKYTRQYKPQQRLQYLRAMVSRVFKKTKDGTTIIGIDTNLP